MKGNVQQIFLDQGLGVLSSQPRGVNIDRTSALWLSRLSSNPDLLPLEKPETTHSSCSDDCHLAQLWLGPTGITISCKPTAIATIWIPLTSKNMTWSDQIPQSSTSAPVYHHRTLLPPAKPLHPTSPCFPTLNQDGTSKKSSINHRTERQ